MNVSRIAPPTPPELEFWRGRSLQTPTGPMDRDFGSSLSLQEKFVELSAAPDPQRLGGSQVRRRAVDRCRAPLGGLKSDECIEDGASDPSRTRVLEGSWPPNTDRADGS